MIIGIDIDDTLTNLVKQERKIAKKYLKTNKLSTKVIDKYALKIENYYGWSDAENDAFWDESYMDVVMNARPRKGVAKYVQKLKDASHTIIIITARLDEQMGHSMHYSKYWLNKHCITFDKIVTNRRDKENVCLENNVDLFIDDLPSNCVRVSNAGVDTIMINGSNNYNDSTFNGKRVNNWKEIYNYICIKN